jgi:hypothetical protein
MSESHTLFIVASDKFRQICLDDVTNQCIDLKSSTLVALKEPPEMTNPWASNLQRRILREIEGFVGRSNLRVRVAGHIGPCFGWRNEEPDAPRESIMRDRPLPDKEAMLKSVFGAELNVQVWGFHNDERWSRIWRALTTARDAVNDAATDDEKRNFEHRLLKAFEESQIEDETAKEVDSRWARYEHLSVIGHDILGLFNPLRIKLDTAAERDAAAAKSDDRQYREKSSEKAHRLRAEVRQLLPEKTSRARALLDEAAGILHRGKDDDRWKRAVAKLEIPPVISREGLWEWVGEMGDILKDLARWPDD